MQDSQITPAIRWSRPLRPLMRAGSKLIDRVLCVAGAVLFSQLPEFFQQYLQRLQHGAPVLPGSFTTESQKLSMLCTTLMNPCRSTGFVM